MTPAATARRPPSGVARRTATVREPAEHVPVARVAVDIPLAHLDRTFDYLVSAADDAQAQTGVRVRVRFAGRLVDGYLLERAEQSEHGGRLAMLDRVVSSEPVLAPEIAALCRAVADRYAGTMADVLRLAVPPRHGRVEAERPGAEQTAGRATGGDVAGQDGVPDGGVGSCGSAASGADGRSGGDGTTGGDGAPGGDGPSAAGAGTGWASYTAGPAFLAAIHDGRPARAVWQALPGEDWPTRLAEAAAVAWRGGRGALLVVPDARDLARLDVALTAALPAGTHTVLSADLGPAERYRRFLAVRRGTVRVVAGTRAAAFAPVRDPALLAIFDDGDDLLAEPRAPYPHAREVLGLRSAQQGAALLVGGFARTAEAQLLLRSGWARPIVPPRAELRSRMPRIEAAGNDHAVGSDSAAARARLSPAAFAVARQSLAAGAPVLVQVPRRGYLPGLACADCGRPARCRRCRGPLALARGARTPSCRWCGIAAPRLSCPACGSDRIRATATGSARTAEEIGRAFPGVRLVTSAGDKVLDSVSGDAAIVVATPGAEPVADGGYGAALLMDAGMLLGRADLRAAEEALRRWMAAATLVRSADDGGRVIVGGEGGLPTVQALIRWDPAGHAEAELDARAALGFPPAVAMAALDGDEPAVSAAVRELRLPATGEVLGPVPVDAAPTRRADRNGARSGGDGDPDDAMAVRALVRTAPAERKDLAAALRVLAASRSARKETAPLRIRVDPVELG